MPESSNSSNDIPSLAMGQQLMHGWWYGNQKDHHELYMQATRAALNLPEKDGNIKATTQTYNGIGWRELLVIGLILVGMGVTGAYVLSGEDKTTTIKETSIEDYEIQFFDGATGEQVSVPHISKLLEE